MNNDVVKQAPDQAVVNPVPRIANMGMKPAEQAVATPNPANLSVDAVKHSTPQPSGDQVKPEDDAISPEPKQADKKEQTPDQPKPKKPSNTPVIAIASAVIICLILVGLVVYAKISS